MRRGPRKKKVVVVIEGTETEIVVGIAAIGTDMIGTEVEISEDIEDLRKLLISSSCDNFTSPIQRKGLLDMLLLTEVNALTKIQMAHFRL